MKRNRRSARWSTSFPEWRTQGGLTLIELLIVLTVAAIISVAGAPAFKTFLQNNRLRAQTFTVLNDIQYARSEAVRRKVRVVLCRSADPLAATPACGGSERVWTSGWLVFATGDGNSTYEQASDTLLRVGTPAASGVAVRTNSNSNRNLEINADGSLNEAGTALFAFCDERGGDFGRQIEIALHGRPKLEPGSAGNPVNCANPEAI